MNIREITQRLEIFRIEQLVDQIKISEAAASAFHVELTLKPNTPITESFIHRLELALGQEIQSLSLFRVRGNVVILRFTVGPGYGIDPSEADRVEELPAAYTGADRRVAPRPRSHELIAA